MLEITISILCVCKRGKYLKLALVRNKVSNFFAESLNQFSQKEVGC